MSQPSHHIHPHPRPKAIFGIRHSQLALLFLALMALYINRVNLSEGLVGMTTHSPHAQTIKLSTAEKGLVSGAFFWGYAITAIPGGMASIRFGPFKTLAVSLTFCGIFNFLLPVVATHLGFYGLYIIRIFQGLAQAPVFPSIHTHMSKWAVPRERGVSYAVTCGGSQVGTIIIMVVSGFLSESSAGWPLIFYFSGAVAIVWVVLCLLFLYDSPAKHKNISEEERLYIETNFHGSSHRSDSMVIPWKSIWLSRPFWGIFVAHIFYNWGFWSLISLTPTYLHGVYKFDIKDNGILSALPYVAMFILTLVLSPLADFTTGRKLLSTGIVRKIMNTIAFWVSGSMLLVLGLAAHDPTGSVVCLVLASGSFAGVYTGFLCNHIDLSPNFAGLLMGITNGLANIASILGPTVAGLIVADETKQSDWQIFFVISGVILIFGNAAFLLMASGEIQSWNEGVVKEKPPKTGVQGNTDATVGN